MELDVSVLTIVGNKVIARLTTDGLFAKDYCTALFRESYLFDYIVVSREDEVLWIVDGMTPEWYVPENRQDVFDRYPELKGKF
tara:strand:+ start:455 stop:703 length:249 start_codon:yes stop_codon:yes gene_type:complete